MYTCALGTPINAFVYQCVCALKLLFIFHVDLIACSECVIVLSWHVVTHKPCMTQQRTNVSDVFASVLHTWACSVLFWCFKKPVPCIVSDVPCCRLQRQQRSRCDLFSRILWASFEPRSDWLKQGHAVCMREIFVWWCDRYVLQLHTLCPNTFIFSFFLFGSGNAVYPMILTL
jgi:hypothetical protein